MKRVIAVTRGDGIGPEVVAAAQDVLETVGQRFGHQWVFREALIGGAAIDTAGDPLPDETLAVCRAADAVLFGAVGGPAWDTLPGDLRPERGLLRLRKALDLFANLRPVMIYESLKAASPLKDSIVAQGVDLLVVRELVGGIYFGARGRTVTAGVRAAFDTESYDENEIRRIADKAFELAMGRRRQVTLVDKANVLDSSKLWREVVSEVAASYPAVKLDFMYVDNAAMQLVRNPAAFDVMLTNNIFGDILSDEASQITGSMGMLPSASLSEQGVHLYEPIHGSAPDLAGRDLANPLAAILSAAMMLRISFGLAAEAHAVERAVAAVLDQGLRTVDIQGDQATAIGCRAMGEAVCAALTRQDKSNG